MLFSARSSGTDRPAVNLSAVVENMAYYEVEKEKLGLGLTSNAQVILFQNDLQAAKSSESELRGPF